MQITSGLPEGFNAGAYDMIVVGAGYAGAVCARRLAETIGYRVAVLERRSHIAGNAYDCADEAGILIHEYGPHIYHTFNERVHNFLSRFTKWTDYQHKVLANINGTLMPVPFNHASLKLAFGDERGEELYQKLVETFGKDVKVPIMELRKKNDPDLVEVADYVYENVFLHYTMKQWGQTPEEIDPNTTARVPVFLSEDCRYFQDAYQGMPLEGYTPMFQSLLDHPDITVELGVDAASRLTLDGSAALLDGRPFSGPIIYTGAADELFGCKYGRLPYRTLDFRFETHPVDFWQSHGTVNYTVDQDYTRITEFKYLTGQELPGQTTIMKEYSRAYTGAKGEIPYYAIINAGNNALYAKYRAEADRYPNFHLLGRLAEYKYYNMDAIAARALELCDDLLK